MLNQDITLHSVSLLTVGKNSKQMATIYKTNTSTEEDVWIESGIPKKEAKFYVKQFNNEQSEFVYNYYNQDYSEEEFYSL